MSMDLFQEVERVLSSKTKKDAWVEECVPVIVEVNRQIKSQETAMEEEAAPFKAQLKDITAKYQVALQPLTQMDTTLRDRLVRERASASSVVNPQGVGKVVFAETWGYEIEDVKKVDKAFRVEVVDAKKVKAAIKAGMRSIKGLLIRPEVGVRVYTKEDTTEK